MSYDDDVGEEMLNCPHPGPSPGVLGEGIKFGDNGPTRSGCDWGCGCERLGEVGTHGTSSMGFGGIRRGWGPGMVMDAVRPPELGFILVWAAATTEGSTSDLSSGYNIVQ